MLYSLLQIVFGLFFKILFRAEIHGRENMPKDGAVILAANHMSNWDPPFVATFLSRPVSYMAKAELFKNPIFGSAIRACYAFPVKRGEADRGAIKTAIQILKQGRCLGLFPEGTRSRNGKMHKAEAGVGLIASITNAPVVPAAIIGTNHIFTKGEYFPKLKVIYGEPVVYQGDHKDREQLEAFSQSVMDKIAELKEKNR